MKNSRIEAFLDKHVRKAIADELRLLYGSIQGDVPERLHKVLKTLEGQTRPSRNLDENIRIRN
jgi:hypothetical protein